MTSRLGAVVAGENIWQPLGEREKMTLIHKLDRICFFSEGITKLQTFPRVWNFERRNGCGERRLSYIEKHDFTRLLRLWKR